MIKRGDLWTPTKDATATESMIPYGETAYADGEKITGQRHKIYVGNNAACQSLDTYYFTKQPTKPGGSVTTKVYGLHVLGDHLLIGDNSNNVLYVERHYLGNNSCIGGSYLTPKLCFTDDGTNLYVGGTVGIEKRNISTYAYVAHKDIGWVQSICLLGDYVYGADYNDKKFSKLLKSDMNTIVSTADYGGYACAVATDGTYIFGAGATTKKVYKYQVSDMSKIAESGDYGGTIWCLHADSTHVYCAGETTKKVYKILISDMSKVAESSDYGGTINAMVGDDNFLYIGGATTKKVWIISKSDMSKVAESVAFPADITALAID